MLYSKKLKTILQYKYLFKIILLLCLFLAILRIHLFPKTSKYQPNETKIEGIVLKYKIDGDHLSMTVKGREKVIVHYYFKNKLEKLTQEKKIELGSRIFLVGTLKEPANNTIPNGFNYKKYLLKESIFYLFQAKEIKIQEKNKSLFYKVKNILEKRIDKIDQTGYFRTFILGDKTTLDKDELEKYQVSGISHLFSVSGMHVSFIVGITMYFLSQFTYKNKLKYSIVTLFLLFYLYLTNQSASILRTTISFIITGINYCFNLKIKQLDLSILLLSIITLLNPYLLFDVGFQFSYLISTSILLQKRKIAGYSKKWQQSLYVSYLSFLISLPICLYQFQSINFLSILFNLVMIPLVSTVVFPLTFITMIIPVIYPIYSFMIKILEFLNDLFYQINIGKLIFLKPNIIIVIIYYIIIIFAIKKPGCLLILIIVLSLHFFYPYLENDFQVTILDVGQGDCIFIKYPNNRANILIDTGGKITYQKEKWATTKETNTITSTKIIPYLKSLGVTKLDYLILTHGDYDHMGEAINLVNNIKIEKVIFNCGEYNDLEKELIKVLDKKKIKYYSCIKELNIDKNKLYFLQTKEFDNENDNSNVIYTELNGYKFMFMGDASITTEKEILNKYNLPDIDVLKVGHHGSKTSSSIEFINEINPKYSIISVGKNNRYGHPNDSVLDNLQDSKVYRTDQYGSIMFKINNDRLKIETCIP